MWGPIIVNRHVRMTLAGFLKERSAMLMSPAWWQDDGFDDELARHLKLPPADLWSDSRRRHNPLRGARDVPW